MSGRTKQKRRQKRTKRALSKVAPQAVESIAAQPTLPAKLFEIPIDVLEAAIRVDNAVGDLAVRHFFSDGCYARELTIPAGTLATARQHRTHHLCVVSAGEMTVWESGKPPVVISAPATFIGTPGTRRIGYAHETTVWTTIFPLLDDERDPGVLLDRFTDIVPSLLTAEQIAAVQALVADRGLIDLAAQRPINPLLATPVDRLDGLDRLDDLESLEVNP